ncbi:MAG: hypothetical protein ACUVSX_00225 [Aggregatilineales bacterium]
MKKQNELTCPNCGQRMRYDMRQGKIICPACGHTPLDAMAQKLRANPRPNVKITHRGEVNSRAWSFFQTGHDYLHRGDTAAAAAAFQRAAEYQPDFVDAYYWLAEIATSEAEKRKHLSMVLALDPTHPQALRAIMVLNGQLTPEQAARSYHNNGLQVRKAASPVGVVAKALLCPVCSGNLTVNETTGQVTCRFCGYTEQRAPRRATDPESLALALIKRRAEPVRWAVGERLLHCNQCGAERLLPAHKLVDDCPFCGSKHVILKDALESFDQPDGIVRFVLSEQQAQAALNTSLQETFQRVANFFDNNRIKRAVFNGVYLPFWVFDATVEIGITRTDKRGSLNRSHAYSYYMPTPAQARIESRAFDAIYDVAVCAFTSPPPALAQRLLPYDLDVADAYDERLLARYSAELYSVDFDKASLEARSTILRLMRDKHRWQYDSSDDDEYQVTMFVNVQSMSFRLLLLPVWIVSITEEDGDQRLALINGQTGRVVLGRAQKRRHERQR